MNPIMQWLTEHPETLNTVMVAVSGLIIAIFTAATFAVHKWIANLKALDLTVTAIEKSKSKPSKSAVRYGEKTISTSTQTALYDSIERVSGKRPRPNKTGAK